MKHVSGLRGMSPASISTSVDAVDWATSPFQSLEGMSRMPAPMMAWRTSTESST